MAFGNLPPYQIPNALNFQPVQNALSDVAQTNQNYARMAQQQQTIDLDKQKTASELQTAGLQRQSLQGQVDHQKAEQFGALVSEIANQKDPAEKAKMSTAFAQGHPDIAGWANGHGVDINDPNWSNHIVNLAIGVQDPLKVQASQDEHALKTAQAGWYNDRPRTNVAGATGALVDKLMAQDPTMSLEQAITVAKRGDVAGAERDKQLGEVGGKTAANIPLVDANSQRITDSIDRALGDKALSRTTGPIQGRLPNLSSGAQRAQSYLDEIKGGAFLQAYNDLRGAGAITEREGEAATAAYHRLGNQKLSDEDYRAALNEFKTEVLKLQGIAHMKANYGARTPAVAHAPAPTGGGPVPGAVEGGYRFKGGNPADQNSWEPVR